VTSSEPRTGYHHGDLRNALLTTALELASEAGPTAVTVRESARRVGVSPSAAYRHFADQADLLAAVATEVMSDLGARIRTAVAAVPSTTLSGFDALQRFRAVGIAYVEYAVASPGRYRTAYAPGVAAPGTTEPIAGPPTTATARDHPYVILAEALDDLVAEGVLDPSRRRHAEVAAWAGVHGLAMLLNDGVLGSADTDLQPLLDSTLDMIGIGLCAPTDALPAE
jgi:AcrR family transcriptional regulator